VLFWRLLQLLLVLRLLAHASRRSLRTSSWTSSVGPARSLPQPTWFVRSFVRLSSRSACSLTTHRTVARRRVIYRSASASLNLPRPSLSIVDCLPWSIAELSSIRMHFRPSDSQSVQPSVRTLALSSLAELCLQFWPDRSASGMADSVHVVEGIRRERLSRSDRAFDGRTFDSARAHAVDEGEQPLYRAVGAVERTFPALPRSLRAPCEKLQQQQPTDWFRRIASRLVSSRRVASS
jgi:hypothetical protein